jgi:type II secretory pathway pseudopilin PulG
LGEKLIKIRRSQAGYSLIEVLIAASLSTIVLIGVTAMLRDFTKSFIKAERQNVMVMIRTRVINEISRKDSWVYTYNNNTSFACLFLSVADPNCGTGDTRFIVYDAAGKTIVNATAANPTTGFTKTGIACPTPAANFNYPSLNCPIRLEVSWTLKNLGYNADMSSSTNFNYVPTNMMPYGYYPDSFFPSWPVGSGGYKFFGTVVSQVEVTGTFSVYSGVGAGKSQAENLANELQPSKYGFKLLREVP